MKDSFVACTKIGEKCNSQNSLESFLIYLQLIFGSVCWGKVRSLGAFEKLHDAKIEFLLSGEDGEKRLIPPSSSLHPLFSLSPFGPSPSQFLSLPLYSLTHFTHNLPVFSASPFFPSFPSFPSLFSPLFPLLCVQPIFFHQNQSTKKKEKRGPFFFFWENMKISTPGSFNGKNSSPSYPQDRSLPSWKT